MPNKPKEKAALNAGEFFKSYPHLWVPQETEVQAELQLSDTDAEEKTEEQKQTAESEIVQHQRIVDYDTKEYPVETIVAKYLARKAEEENELFVPDYQREFVWSDERQSKFIESILIGLPVPYIFTADVTEKDARLEIVDGSQRIRTLSAFITNQLVLVKLQKLTHLNGFRFCELHVTRQRRFLRQTIHMIELGEKADEAVRRDVFERINSGSDVLKDMEMRIGIKPGPFLDLIEECSALPLFKQLAPLSDFSEKRKERQEFTLRFFAYLDNYQGFEKRVKEFLDEYLSKTEAAFSNELKERLRSEFTGMLDFVQRTFPSGFKKADHHVRTPRIRFEAIAVGSALALRERPGLVATDIQWLDSDEFKILTTSDASNSRPKVIKRIEFVKNKLLGL